MGKYLAPELDYMSQKNSYAPDSPEKKLSYLFSKVKNPDYKMDGCDIEFYLRPGIENEFYNYEDEREETSHHKIVKKELKDIIAIYHVNGTIDRLIYFRKNQLPDNMPYTIDDILKPLVEEDC